MLIGLILLSALIGLCYILLYLLGKLWRDSLLIVIVIISVIVSVVVVGCVRVDSHSHQILLLLQLL